MFVALCGCEVKRRPPGLEANLVVDAFVSDAPQILPACSTHPIEEPCPQETPYCCTSGLEGSYECTADRKDGDQCAEQVYVEPAECDVPTGVGCTAEAPYCCAYFYTYCVDHPLWSSYGIWNCTPESVVGMGD